jgi:hypothetical protein
MSQGFNKDPFISGEESQFSVNSDMMGLPAWTEIEAGRFMPRRVRGSFHGRALG